jgi:hypothetical protein
VVATFRDDLELGLRVASSDIDGNSVTGPSPLSSYQTFQNNGSKKGLALDQAYMKWSPLHTADWKGGVTFGKMPNPFVFSEVACGMDPDYTPEGVAIQVERKLGAKHSLRWINGAFILDELAASGADPLMVGSQLRFDSKWTDHLSSSLGVMWLGFVHNDQLANGAVPDANVGNWRTIPSGTNQSDAVPSFDFSPVLVDASVVYLLEHAPLYRGPCPARLVLSYLNNPDAPRSADNYAWTAGFVLGKAGSRRTWEAAYQYKWLGANSIYEDVVDDDFGAYWATTAGRNFGRRDAAGFFTGTNVRGHLLKLAYSPSNIVTLGLRWYHSQLIAEPVVTAGSANSLHDRLMVDVDLKF